MVAKKEDIILLPNNHLRQRSKKVGLITDGTRKIVADMESATLDWEDSREHELAVALAAIQIDVPLRIVIIRNNFDNKADRSFTTFINPVITKYEGQVEEDYEGCLSIANLYGKVPRHSRVRVKAMDVNGKEFRITAKGFQARLLQHEIDHNNGVVFIDHIKGKPEAFFKLSSEGKLEPLNYEKDIRHNSILW